MFVFLFSMVGNGRAGYHGDLHELLPDHAVLIGEVC